MNKRTQYFARKNYAWGVWCIKNEVPLWRGENDIGWHPSVWSVAELRAEFPCGAKENPVQKISRDDARKLFPKVFRRA